LPISEPCAFSDVIVRVYFLSESACDLDLDPSTNGPFHPVIFLSFMPPAVLPEKKQLRLFEAWDSPARIIG